jgi:hypothetical protein
MGDRDLELKEGIYFEGRDSSRVMSNFIKDVAMKEKRSIRFYKVDPKRRIPVRGQNANIPFQH